MKNHNPIVVVGAGAAGLMAAWELSKAGERVVILEGRDRLGGRIEPLSSEEFGYPAEGGAEFVHGESKLTRALIEAAGLHFVPIGGEAWRFEDGKLVKGYRELPHEDSLMRKLNELERDVTVVEFLDEHFAGEQFTKLRESVLGLVRGYDAADPARASAFALRAELSAQEGGWQQGRIMEGYGALIDFLAAECRRAGCEIELNWQVKSIEYHSGDPKIHGGSGAIVSAQVVLVTVPLPLIPLIDFSPPIPRKIQALREIGYGSVIKVMLRFKDRWWESRGGKILSKMSFLFCDEAIPTWWTQFPDIHATLTGWIAGPNTEPFKGMPEERVIASAFEVLSKCFGVSSQVMHDQCVRGNYGIGQAIPLPAARIAIPPSRLPLHDTN